MGKIPKCRETAKLAVSVIPSVVTVGLFSYSLNNVQSFLRVKDLRTTRNTMKNSKSRKQKRAAVAVIKSASEIAGEAMEVAKARASAARRSGGASLGAIRKGLSDQSYYLKSLRDPVNNEGCKIPDLVTVPSATTQCTQKITASVNAQGVVAIVVNFGSTNTGVSGGYQTSTSAATTAVPAWNGIAAKSYATNMGLTAQAKRLVSAMLSVEYQGAPLNRKGRIICNFDPMSTSATNPPTASVNTDLNTRPYAVEINLALTPWGVVRYVPQDNNACAYTQVNASTAYGWGIIWIDGATSGDNVEFTITENYEFIPQSSVNSMVTPTPSISDPLEMSVAANAISSDPEFAIAQPKTDPNEHRRPAGAPGLRVHPPSESSHTGREATFLERLLGGVKSALPAIGKGLATGAQIAAMVAPLL